jgi:aspartokinase
MEEKTTAELVKEEIKSSLYINEILKKGLVNYSALVRMLLPKIQKINKKANFQSVLIAIQRYHDEIKLEKSDEGIGKILKEAELIMKNHIVSLTIERTKQAMNLINKVSQTIRWDLGDIMFFIQGSGEITLILDKKNAGKFTNLGKKIIDKRENLAIISIKEAPAYSKDTKGYLALLCSTLADNNINILDIASTHAQIIFIIDEKDLSKAYETLNRLIEHYK